jgi:PAS domain S-box-containing protein
MLLDLLSKATKQPVALKEGMQQEVTKLREELEHRNVELNRLRENQKHIEAELRREKKRGQMYLHVAGVIILIIDDKEKVSLINNMGCELLGYSENEIIEKNWFDGFIPEKVRTEAKAFFSRLMDGQIDKVESHENPVLTKSGHERSMAWRCAVLKDDSGASIGMLCSGEDITVLQSAELACKRAEAALRDNEERFRLMVESLGDYEFVIMDSSGYVTSWAAAERMNGYRENEIVGQHFSCFYPAEDFQAGRPMKILNVAETEGRFEEDGWRIRKNGARKWANNVITAQRDESGKLRGFSSITRYMGERARERKLRFD